ncbi:uncharacterized protein LOC122798215 [Protopterus annectens]|uniref:uncharacterized protein LOC122798215 n=1 Tax=Protopterus annectens TaxID=7888 RepID=UPI001CF9A0A5|nr:uncharacterized protein LOC122798215 [Protopterus annectens]
MELVSSPSLCLSGNFTAFHDKIMQRDRAAKSKPNINCRRKREFISEEKKDASYWEKRKKNNEAAKRSREKRRLNDMVLENKVLALNEENVRLKRELLQLKLRFGMITTASYIEKSQQLAGGTVKTFYNGYSNGASSVINSDSSENEQSSKGSGSVSLAKYSPRGSVSDMSDGSSRDSPIPLMYTDGSQGSMPLTHSYHLNSAAISSRDGLHSSAQNLLGKHEEQLNETTAKRGAILFSTHGFAVDLQESESRNEDHDAPTYYYQHMHKLRTTKTEETHTQDHSLHHSPVVSGVVSCQPVPGTKDVPENIVNDISNPDKDNTSEDLSYQHGAVPEGSSNIKCKTNDHLNSSFSILQSCEENPCLNLVLRHTLEHSISQNNITHRKNSSELSVNQSYINDGSSCLNSPVHDVFEQEATYEVNTCSKTPPASISPSGFSSVPSGFPESFQDVKTSALPHKLRLKCRIQSTCGQDHIVGASSVGQDHTVSASSVGQDHTVSASSVGQDHTVSASRVAQSSSEQADETANSCVPDVFKNMSQSKAAKNRSGDNGKDQEEGVMRQLDMLLSFHALNNGPNKLLAKTTLYQALLDNSLPITWSGLHSLMFDQHLQDQLLSSSGPKEQICFSFSRNHT